MNEKLVFSAIMKTVAVLFAFLAVVLTCNAQNTFPASGNVGIGTANPVTSLHVRGTATFGTGVEWNLGSVGNVQITGTPASPISSRLIYGTDNTGWQFRIAKNNGSVITDQFTIQDNGNVGIGTIVPVEKFQVGIGTEDVSLRLGVADFHSVSYNSTYNGLLISANGTHGGIQLNSSLPSWYMDLGGRNALSGIDSTDRFVIARQPAGSNTHNAFLTITNGGNVGIGTTSPNNELTVSSALVDFGNARYSGLASGNGVVLNADAGGAGTASVGIEFGGNGVAHANLLWRPNERQFVFGTGNYPTDLSNPYGYAGLAVMGNVGIGTTNPTEKLTVKGRIRAQEVVVDNNNWSDYVFADDYKLQSLSEVEAQIKTNKQLPGVPSAQEVAEKGVSIGDMQAVLLAKIEELTLHQIQQEKRLNAQSDRIEHLESENARLKSQLK